MGGEGSAVGGDRRGKEPRRRNEERDCPCGEPTRSTHTVSGHKLLPLLERSLYSGQVGVEIRGQIHALRSACVPCACHTTAFVASSSDCQLDAQHQARGLVVRRFLRGDENKEPRDRIL